MITISYTDILIFQGLSLSKTTLNFRYFKNIYDIILHMF